MKATIVPALLASVFVLAACSTETDEAAADQSESADDDSSADAVTLVLDAEAGEGATLVLSDGASTSFDPECLISETGVAGIEFPATLGDFVDAFPEGTALSFQSAYMVDFGALCARSGGEEALCVIFESYDAESYRPGIETLAMGVYADQCRTAEGVGPGTSIADVVSAYGAPRFGFSYDNEAREYVSFANAPVAYSFRAESASAEAADGEATAPAGRHGGDYNGVTGDGYFETTVAHPDARLWEIWLSPPL